MNASEEFEEYLDPKDVEFFKFTGLVADAKVSLQQEPFDISKYPANVSLISVSNKRGYVAAATTKGFVLDSTKLLRKTFYSAAKSETVALEEGKILIPLNSPIRQIRFSAKGSQLLVAAASGKLLSYSVDDILTNKENSSPAHIFDLGHEIIDLRPNPEALPDLAAVLFDNHQCKIINITNGNTECHLPVDNVSAICWSPKGKQIAVGKLDGSIQHFDTNGALKSELSIPKLVSAAGGRESQNRSVQDVLWIENHVFLALYAKKRENEEDTFENEGFIINRKPANGSSEPEYIRLAEITPIFTNEGRGNHFYMETINNLGKEIKHLVIIANAATGELSVVGQGEDGDWATWALPENALANFPLSDDNADTYPLGLALDLTADEALPPFDPSEDETKVNPMPIFYFINDEGHLGAYHCYNIELARSGEPYSALNSCITGPIGTTEAKPTEAKPTEVKAATESKPTVNTSGFSAFGAVSNNTGSFGDLLSGKSDTSTPSSSGGFGSFGGSIPSFSNLGSAQKIPATPSTGFAAPKFSSETVVPSFGSTTNIGFASNKPATTSADKPLSSFGNIKSEPTQTTAVPAKTSTFATPTASTTPAFGSTSNIGGFGSLAKNTVPGATNPTTTPTSTFGSFGSFGTKPAATTPTAGFGSSGFGSTATPAATTQTSGFGSSILGSSASKPTTTTTTTTAASSAFGSTSTLGGFGSLAKNTVPGATAPSFGATTTLGSGGGFGSLAKNTVPGAVAPASKPLFGPTDTKNSFGLPSTTKAAVAPPSESTTKPIPTTAAESATKPKETNDTIIAPTPVALTPVVPKSSTNTTPENSSNKSTPAIETKTKDTKEKLSITAKDGMAREYEAIYIKVCESIQELAVVNERLDKAISKNLASSKPKTEADLSDKSAVWNLCDAVEYGVITEKLTERTQDYQDNGIDVMDTLETLSEICKKYMDKKEDIRYLLQKEVGTDVIDLIDKRELDTETKQMLNTIMKKSEIQESMLSSLEFKIQEYKKRNKIKSDHLSGQLTLYSLHRAVRDVQRDIISRSNEISELEEKLDNAKFNDSRRKAQQSTGGFSCEDISDSEEEEESDGFNIAAIQNTTRYLRRFNFISDVCEKASTRSPLQCPVD
ncbi:hypothetical protein BD770DRAFT_408646 [Pilaira anomala]|nr:hypothetical protein BD770DRAFT_408646 [Pilaira anomala]